MKLYNFSDYLVSINEGLIKTYDIDKTIDDMVKLINSMNINFNIDKLNSNTFKINLFEFDTILNKPDILNKILIPIQNLYGWFPSYMELKNFYGLERRLKFRKETLLIPKLDIVYVSIIFESKFDLIENNIPSDLYHLTIKNYKESILKNGLTPKAKSKLSSHDFSDRIYLCKSLDSCKGLIDNMKLFYSNEKSNITLTEDNPKRYYNKNTEWIIFEIDADLAGIKKLYKDPNYKDGYYYYLENIKGDALKIIEEE